MAEDFDSEPIEMELLRIADQVALVNQALEDQNELLRKLLEQLERQ